MYTATRNTNYEKNQTQWKLFYDNFHFHRSSERVKSLPWDSGAFLTAFQKASSARDGVTLRSLRKLVLEFTRRACTPTTDGYFAYQVENDNERITFCQNKQEMIDQIAQTELHQFDVSDGWSWTNGLGIVDTLAQMETEYCVIDGDCLDAAENLIKIHGLNPAVLNMASEKTPGGGYKGGAGAQEENLFRRTNLLRVLANEDKWYKRTSGSGNGKTPNQFYPLPALSTVYTPSCVVIRSSEATGYGFLSEPYKVAFIASAAFRQPKLDKTGRFTPELETGFLDKTRAVLWTCAFHGHDSIVLSAWGCGAFRNPPRHVAELFKQVLNEDWLKGRFKNVTFAIFDDHNARGEGNLKPFMNVFL